MKKIISLIIISCLLVSVLTLFSSCGSDKIEDSFLFDYLEQGILGKTEEEILSLDPHAEENGFREKEKEGYWRLIYTFKFDDGTGDAFIPESGQWITQVKYFFDLETKKLDHVEFRYMQTDYSEGLCSKRLNLFTTYLDEKYGTGSKTDRGTAWDIAGATFEMSRQNGGWILFNYDPYISNSFIFDLMDQGLMNKTTSEVLSIDTNASLYSYTEKTLSDSNRVTYSFIDDDKGTGDAFFPHSGKWMTSVKYMFDIDYNTLFKMEVRYSQTESDTALYNKRMTQFTTYLTKLYGNPVNIEFGKVWTLKDGVLTLSTQGDSTIIFTYELPEQADETVLPNYSFQN